MSLVTASTKHMCRVHHYCKLLERHVRVISILMTSQCVLCFVMSDCANGDIRLRGGSNYTEGRVEICYNAVWGTVCSDLWGTPDATVACRQLGLSPI